jgi:hypothetical protein
MNHNTAKLLMPGIRSKNSIYGTISLLLFSFCSAANLFGMQVEVPDVEILFDNFSKIDNSSGPAYSDFSINLASVGTNPADISVASWSTNSDDLGNVYFAAAHKHDVLRNSAFEPLNGNGNTQLSSIFENNSVFYNPAAQGAIGSISFSLDARVSNGVALGEFQSVRFTIFQGDTSVTFFTPSLGLSDGWQNFSVTGLTQEDYGDQINLSGSTNLRFGFGFLSRFDTTPGEQTFAIDADNFRVSITAVPEPSSLLCLIPVMGFIAARRRKFFLARRCDAERGTV